MAKATILSNVLAKALADAIKSAVEAGAGTSKLIIYDGTKPTGGPDAAVPTASTALVTFDLPATVFAAATDANPGGRIRRTATMTTTANTGIGTTKTASWFRVLDGATVADAVIDGTVGVGTTFDMNIDNTSIAASQQVKITNWDITAPESG